MAAFPPKERDAFMAHWAKILGDGRVAGNVVSFEQGGKPEVGCWIERSFWGRGVATAVLSAFLNLVRTRPLYARVAKRGWAR